MISKIIPGDIFKTPNQAGEDQTFVTCGTNVGGVNLTDGGSVAGNIAKNYIPEFASLGKKELGDIHIKTFPDFNTKAIGIVCNQQIPGILQSECADDWSQAVESIREGFNKIQAQIGPRGELGYDANEDCLIDIKSMLTPPDEMKESSPTWFGSIEKIEKRIAEYRAYIKPIVRSVLIGGGNSGTLNNADVAKILVAMQESSANIHLYLNNLEQQAQVAQVIPLFPTTSALAATKGYNEIIRVA